MNRRKILAAALTGPLAMGQGQRSSRDRLIGSWKLISWDATNPQTGEVAYPCGKNATGRITYDAGGRMAAQIMDPDRRKVGTPGLEHTEYIRSIAAQDAAEFSAGYRAYYGSYTVDEIKSTVTHHVEGELDPVAVGRNRLRTVDFVTDNRIVLGYAIQGRQHRLLWERERP